MDRTVVASFVLSLSFGGLFAGCGDASREDERAPPPTTIDEVGTESDGDESTGADPGSSSDSGQAPPASGADPDGSVGCEAVDFLFVIDNSGSMADEQQALIDSVPGFVQSIEQRLPAGTGSFHILVTDVDPWVYGGCPDACDQAEACEASSGDGSCDCGYPCALRTLCTAGGEQGGDYVCGVTEPAACEDVMGAGVVHPRGRDASDLDCDFSSGQRYINNNEPDLAQAFDCAARVGTSSSLGEKPMEAMVRAVASDGEVAACNEGFLRDDAVLVVVVITDEDDNGPHADDALGDSEGDPAAWVEALVEAKGGNEDAIVMMSLIGDSDQPDGICAPLDPSTFEGAEPAPRIRDFTERFGSQGIVGSVCAPSYVEFFMTAVDTIGQACDAFVPVG